MSTETAAPDTTTDRHLAMLDELAEIGMVLVRRLHELPPLPRQDVSRDFDRLARAVRRCILMYHLLQEGRLPHPKAAPDFAPAPNPAPVARTPAAHPSLRGDSCDRLDDVSGPFQQVVAEIVQDIQAALATCHHPVAQADFIQEIARRPLPIPHRFEADTADLN